MNHSMELIDETDATKILRSALEIDWDKLISEYWLSKIKGKKYWLSSGSSAPKT